jgi:phage gpG-like protein
MFKIELKGDTELIAKIDDAPNSVRRELTREITAIVLLLEGHIKNDKLSGQVLHVRSGDLRRSVHAVLPVTQTATGVTGKVAQSGDVKYGAIHEFGGKTPAHVIEAKNAKALHFMMGGKEVFAKRVNHPGSVMPERSYMRSGLADLRDDIADRLQAAVKRGIQL